MNFLHHRKKKKLLPKTVLLLINVGVGKAVVATVLQNYPH